MNIKSNSGFGSERDANTDKPWNKSAYGLPQKFWDWFGANLEKKWTISYRDHAVKEHWIECSGKPHPKANHRLTDFVSDLWLLDDFSFNDFGFDVFECHYFNNDDTQPRKFHMNLPTYNKKTNEFIWHPTHNYSAVFGFTHNPNELEVISVWVRPDGRGINPQNKWKYSKGVGTPKQFQL
jgi:hypothetical protein